VTPAPAAAPPTQPVVERAITPIATPVSAVSPAPQPATLAALKGYCIVAMKARQFVVARPEFSSVYEDRLYQFANADNKAAFDRNPESFAPVYAGIDPVEWLKTHKMVEGKFLREFEGRFYLFSSKENWETFKASPQRFVLNGRSAAQDVVTR
jgi:YHS domain-containing protein